MLGNIKNSNKYFKTFSFNFKKVFFTNDENKSINKIESFSKKFFSLFKLVSITFDLLIGTIFRIKEHAINKFSFSSKIRNIAKQNNIELSEIIKINQNTFINQTFITFPYLEISRLGDYAKFYLNAKWIAYQLNVPVIIRPFPDSDSFKISENHKFHLQESSKTNNFKFLSKEQAEKICSGELKKEDLGLGIFTVPYFWDWRPKINWAENKAFKAAYQDDFAPASHIKFPIVEPVKGKVNIAIQVRDGGDFDNLQDKFLYPLRFPDLSYYDAQLAYVLNLDEYKNKPLNIYIFTDAVDPSSLKTRFQTIVNQNGHSQDVTINYRSNQCHADEAILTDLISMANFSVFIRAKSGFSDLSAFLGQPELEIHPHTGKLTEEGVASIDQVKIIKRDSKNPIVNEEGDLYLIQEGRYAKQWPQDRLADFAYVYRCYKGAHS
ncbi:hypothetical protein DB44_DW00050 [Candidatus Protochlamydia amoebophila]|uniref:Uncharacterized protein n=1 Tax=Candidatus Protochlamydia amoebophila TaxID=362787 RepID=A0A0C1JIZ2_9BACT|nr:hypothetical protein DB44_DW00050 [Candidatus Protochlamydia amoebophila]